MSNAGQVSTLAKETTRIQTTIGTVMVLVDQATRAGGRLETWKSRVMGLHTDGVVSEEAPEPVRSDLELLSHHLDELQNQLNRIDSHLNDIEAV